MVTHRLPNYLRTYRKRAGLSQEDVAILLGAHTGTMVSRYERDAREPSVKTALALEVILHAPLDELFAGTSQEVRTKIMRRARRVHEQLLRNQRDRHTARQIQALTRLLSE